MVHQSMTVDQLTEHMQNRVVRFMFVKTDGSLREAVGTRNPGLIPPAGQSTSRRQPPSVVNFWDVMKGAWRCLSVNSQVFLVQ